MFKGIVIKKDEVYFEKLPFYWHPLESPEQNELPEALPFYLKYDKEKEVLKQIPHKSILDILALAYKKGSHIVGLMDKEGIGYLYFQEFLSFLDELIPLKDISQKKVLELGCGTGYLLYRLEKLGAEVIGYEPGYSKIGKYPIPVIDKFYPSEEIQNKKFDLIIGYGFIEHIVHSNEILEYMQRNLHRDGILVLSVPDCTEQIINGDMSMLLHEHFYYFTPETFVNFIRKKGYNLIKLKVCSGKIFAAFSKGNKSFKEDESVNLNPEIKNFFSKVQKI